MITYTTVCLFLLHGYKYCHEQNSVPQMGHGWISNNKNNVNKLYDTCIKVIDKSNKLKT